MLWSGSTRFRRVQVGNALSRLSSESEPVAYSRPGVESIAARQLGRRRLPDDGNAGTPRPAAAQKNARTASPDQGFGRNT
jgi:hypothetical protein